MPRRLKFKQIQKVTDRNDTNTQTDGESELRQMLIINFGHNPLRKSSEENQDVVGTEKEGERSSFTQLTDSCPCTYLTPAMSFATPVLLYILQIPSYTQITLTTEITETAHLKVLCSFLPTKEQS